MTEIIKNTDFEKREFYKELFSIALPIGLQNLLTALIGATDALMLGRLTQDAVSAVSLANQIVFIMNLFISAVTGGGGVLIAQYWGKGDRIMVKNLFCMMLKWCFAISLIFFVLTVFIPDLLMGIYTSDKILIETGASYLRAVGISYLFSGLTQCYYLKMKAEGRAFQSAAISIAVLVTDVTLDYFLIYGIADAKGFGAAGSAYSTVAAEFIALAWCIAESYRKESVHPDLQGMRWSSASAVRAFLKISLPMTGSALAWGLGISMHSFIMGHLGSDATAAASITAVIQEIITCLCRGIAAGAGIMIGRLLGQSLYDKARIYGRRFCFISFAAGGIHIILLCAAGPVLKEIFILTESAAEYLRLMLMFTAVYAFAYSVNTIIVCGIFPAGGDTGYDAVSVFFASWCFALPAALLGAFIFHWPVMAVYIFMCSDEIVKLPWLYGRYRKYLWLNNLTGTGPADAQHMV